MTSSSDQVTLMRDDALLKKRSLQHTLYRERLHKLLESSPLCQRNDCRVMMVIDLFVKALLSYMLGGLLGGLIVGRLKGGVDIRQHGSGNAGGTNALRTQGWWFALWVMIIDIGKGWLAVRVIGSLSLPFTTSSVSQWSGVVCAMAVVVGHVYPCWFGFRGGKGAATLVGVVWGLASTALPWMLGLWLISLMVTGFVGLSTMLATFSFNFWVWFKQAQPQFPLLVFSITMTLFVIYTHRTNIARMRHGKENRAKSLWLFKSRATESSHQ